MSSGLSQIFHSPLADALGWTILHSLWQGVLLLLLLRLVYQLAVHRSAASKYAWAYAILCLQLVVTVLTFYWMYDIPTASAAVSGELLSSPLIGTEATDGIFTDRLHQLNSYLSAWLPVVAAVWLLGMLFFLLRLAGACYYWEQLRRNNLSDVPESWRALLSQLIRQMNIGQSVALKCSAAVNSPLLIGQFKPLILLPVAMVNQLSIQQVEAILAHELAHLRRYDYVLNVFQLLIEAIFYYHPANWWIGKQVRIYRELASDDLAIGQTGEALIYAKTLLAVAEQPTVRSVIQPDNYALGWLGGQKEELLTRIKRILNQPDKQSEMREKFAVTSLLLLLALGVSLGAGWPESPEIKPDKATIKVLLPVVDTLPKGTIRLKTDDNGETMEVMIKDQTIQELSVNGETIPSADFPKYQERVEEMVANVPPPPPAPPAPPAAPTAPAPPAPPGAPAPPPPPPAPRVDGEKAKRYIIHERTVDDQESEEGEKTIVVEIEEIEGEHVWVDEKDGEITIKVIDEDGKEEVQVIKVDGDMSEKEIEEWVIEVNEDSEKRMIEVEKIVEESMIRVEKELREVEKHLQDIEEEELERIIEIEEKVHLSGDDWLGRQLVTDGLIDDPNNFNFKLNSSRLKVDGDTQSSDLHQRYMKLYEEHSGKPFTEDTNINLIRKMR